MEGVDKLLGRRKAAPDPPESSFDLKGGRFFGVLPLLPPERKRLSGSLTTLLLFFCGNEWADPAERATRASPEQEGSGPRPTFSGTAYFITVAIA
jgi:hypothetical protein